jgi:DNA-binding GntR family transcriptional regulator
VERLRALITDGEILPGTKVPERELCERFGVSRTPLREALKVLASEGIVTLRPNRGAVVSTLTLEEIDEVYPVIAALEAVAGELACRFITPEELERVRTLHAQMLEHWRRQRLQPYFRTNQAIHEAILDATRNETLKSVYRGLSSRIKNARYLATMTPERWDLAVKEHEDILAALEQRRGEDLGRILRTHLFGKLETVRDWLGQAQRELEPLPRG